MKNILLVALVFLFSFNVMADVSGKKGEFSQAELEDLALIAESRGWTMEESKAHAWVTKKIGKLAEEMASKHPDIYAGAVLSEYPGGTPSIYFKGEVPVAVVNRLSGKDVSLVENETFSAIEMEQREQQVHSILIEQGYTEIMTSYDLRAGGKIEAVVTQSESASTLTALPESLQDTVSITIQDDPVGENFTSFGGMMMRDGRVDECTSGWSVRHSNGTRGITTAAHCTGVDLVVHGSNVHRAPFYTQHLGAYGDIELHTTEVAESAIFYAKSNTIRKVTSVEPRSSTVVGESICVYGRFSNHRFCQYDVFATSVSCTIGGVTSSRLVQMNGNSNTFGDSGGGWSWGNRAYGSVKGTCGGKAIFSHADLYDEAIGVRVITQ